MADFDPPFANTGPRRSPTEDEKANGMPCGPADQSLFNGLFHRIEAEIGTVIDFAGLVGSDTTYDQLLQAIQSLINAATGGGVTTDYVLLSQSRSRLPIFPEIQTTDGKINITSPGAGTVRIPGGVTFLHRGIFPVVTALTDFATVASKVYHLRWSPTGGYQLFDLINAGYNPTALAETDAAFDSTYDNMLIARIITNAGNVATITPLANKARLDAQEFLQQAATASSSGLPGANTNAATSTGVFVLNWARRPKVSLIGNIGQGSSTAPKLSGYAAWNDNVPVVTRYQASQTAGSVWDSSVLGMVLYANFHLLAVA